VRSTARAHRPSLGRQIPGVPGIGPATPIEAGDSLAPLTSAGFSSKHAALAIGDIAAAGWSLM
jgi:hypothetical protein